MDIDTVLSKLAAQQKKTEQLADSVNRLNQEVEEERSARRLLEKVLLKMAEEQTLKVVERECAKERNARNASMDKMKQYADLIHEKITTREREASAERQVQRSMIQVLARTRRALNKLHEQVMNNQGDLEEVRGQPCADRLVPARRCSIEPVHPPVSNLRMSRSRSATVNMMNALCIHPCPHRELRRILHI